MRFSIRRDLGLQLLALYLLFVGPVILASIVFDRVTSDRLEADAKASDLALARAIAQETNTTMNYAQQAVEALASYPEVIAADSQGMALLFSNLMTARPDVNLVYRLNSEGIMLFHYPTGPGSTIGDDFSFRDYFQRALNTRRPLLSQGRISPTTNQPVTTAVMPLWDPAGRFLGLVATNIKLQALSTTLQSISNEYRPEEAFDVAIIDSAGNVIAHPDSGFLLVDINENLPEVTRAVLAGQSGSTILSGSASNASNPETLYSYVPITSAGWGVIVSRPAAVAFASSHATHQGVLLTIWVFLIVGIFFWVALSFQVIRPLERLAALSQTIGVDDRHSGEQLKTLEALSRRPDQIGHLIRSLERMEHAIEERLRELSTLLETSAAVVSSLDHQTVLNRILEQLERLTGIQKCAIVALDSGRGVFIAQASRGLSRRYAEQMAISPSEPLSVTMRALRTGFPIQVSDTEEDASFAPMRPRSRSEGYRSLLAVPLNTQHAPPSALLVYHPDPHLFSEREIGLLTSFANHATMAIENAALFSRSDMRLREQTRRLEALIQSLQDGLLLEDLQGLVLYANRRVAELVDLTPEQMIGKSVSLLIERLLSHASRLDSDQTAQTRLSIQEALQGSGPRSVEFTIHLHHRKLYLHLQVFEVTDAKGKTIGHGQILRDITQIREIDRMKSSLISTVSHELRTPLAGIKGYVTTLLAEDVEWDKISQREFLEIISYETDRLTKLVSDLLDMSRIEAGNLNVSRVECSLREIIERAVNGAHPSSPERVILDIPPDMPLLYIDPQRIEAVFRNLIENAAKYSSDNSSIRVRAVLESENAIIQVLDEGPGIPAEYNQRVFESFYRIGDGFTNPVPGAGLGLSICQGFVSAHGGSIWIEPRESGTCVAFSLPLNSLANPTIHGKPLQVDPESDNLL